MRGNSIARNVLLVALTTRASAQFSSRILERASTCGNPTFVQCPGQGLPSDFCCPSSSTCMTLAGNTTLLCCPSGKDCSKITTISCDISNQNPLLSPDTTLITTALNVTLATCGNACCPFGYSCGTSNTCIQNLDQRPTPGASSPVSSLPTASSSSPPSAQPTAITPTPAPANTNTTLIQSCNKFPTEAVLAGFFPGLILGALMALAGICLFRQRRRQKRRSSSSFGNISEPQISEHTRTDFLRKPPVTPSSTAGSVPAQTGTVERVRSLFRKSQVNLNSGMEQSSPRPPMPLNINKTYQRPPLTNANKNVQKPSGTPPNVNKNIQRRPVTPPNANKNVQKPPVTPPLQRQRSYEDVDIFADLDITNSLRGGLQAANSVDPRASHQTTMSDVMGLAGLPKGQPYVYKGQNVTSPNRGPSTGRP